MIYSLGLFPVERKFPRYSPPILAAAVVPRARAVTDTSLRLRRAASRYTDRAAFAVEQLRRRRRLRAAELRHRLTVSSRPSPTRNRRPHEIPLRVVALIHTCCARIAGQKGEEPANAVATSVPSQPLLPAPAAGGGARTILSITPECQRVLYMCVRCARTSAPSRDAACRWISSRDAGGRDAGRLSSIRASGRTFISRTTAVYIEHVRARLFVRRSSFPVGSRRKSEAVVDGNRRARSRSHRTAAPAISRLRRLRDPEFRSAVG